MTWFEKPKFRPARPDPPIRADGRCAMWGKSCSTPHGERPPLAVREHDPFCSTQCCKRYHHVEQGTGS